MGSSEERAQARREGAAHGERPGHDAYFVRWQERLSAESDGVPCVLLDMARLEGNVARVRERWPRRHALRLAVKSLPCTRLLRWLAERFETERFMVFHPGHLRPLLDEFTSADVLMGKPVPTLAVRRALERFGPAALARVRWLVDDERSARELAALARTQNQRVRAAIELDVGLHRGGASSASELERMAPCFVGARAPLSFAGVMGYDGHLGRIPWPLQRVTQSHQRSMERYRALCAALDQLGFSWRDAVRNAGGSLSFMEYRDEDPTDDLTIGSCLVKPSHFDDARLSALAPAMYIAAPVLKRVPRFSLPDNEWLDVVASRVKGLRGPGLYLFGGRWNAAPASPPDLVRNLAMGDSANQSLYQLDRRSVVRPGEWVFFRPEESEAVMDAFATAFVLRGDGALERWPTLRAEW